MLILYFVCDLLAALQVSELELYCTKYDLQRLELYSRNMADYHLIMDLVPAVARLHTLNRLQSHLSAVQLVSSTLFPSYVPLGLLSPMSVYCPNYWTAKRCTFNFSPSYFL